MAITGARAYYAVGAPTPRSGGIERHADVVNVSDPHLLMGAEYETALCSPAHSWDDNCAMTPGTTKVVDSLDVVEGDPFAVYSLVECGPVGFTPARLASLNKDAFSLKEARGVEQHLRDQFIADGDSLWSGNPADPVNAVAELDYWLLVNYAGQGLIHMGPTAATLCFSKRVLEYVDDRLVTPSGTPVVVGAYVVAAAGEVWAFASGRVTLLRGPLTAVEAQVGTTPAGERINATQTLVERSYVALVECGAAKVKVATT